MPYSRTYPTFDHPSLLMMKSGMVSTREEREAGIVNNYSREFNSTDGTMLYGAYYYGSLFDRGISEDGFYDPIVKNKLYGRIQNELRYDSATLGTTMLEWRSSYEMIAKRALQLRRLYQKWRRSVSGPPITVRRSSKKYRNRWRHKDPASLDLAKRMSAGWLEYWMGWAPLVGDITNAVKQLDLPGAERKLRVAVRNAYSRDDKFYMNGPFPWYAYSLRFESRSRYGCTAHVEVTNANLFVARNMGLTNPLEWAWEITPWSWMVNWFVNVDQVLSQHSVYHGLAITNVAGTLKSEVNGSCRNTYWSYNGSAWVPLIDIQGFSGTAFFRRKQWGLPAPELVVDIPLRLSLSRAATAISLLVGQLNKP